MRRTVMRDGASMVWLFPALAALLILAACIAPTEEPAVKAPSEKAQEKVPAEKKEAAPPTIPEKDRLPEIPPDKLPPRTRPKPDPSRDKYVREPVHVWVEEIVTPQKGPAYEPSPRITENYLKAYINRSGHPTVANSTQAAYRLEGSAKLQFQKQLTARDRPVAWKYSAEAVFRILDKNGDEVARFDIPEVHWENVRSEESTVLNLRRYLAKIAWENICQRNTSLGSPKIVGLINALSLEGDQELPTEQGKGPRAVTTDDVVKALADCGFETVPYLLEALTDDRIVRMEAKYPGLAGRNLDDLKIHHIADKALEEIFQKVSRMSLDTDQKARYIILKGWEREWARFCRTFAELEERQKAERAKTTAKEKTSSGAPGGTEEEPLEGKASQPGEKKDPVKNEGDTLKKDGG